MNDAHFVSTPSGREEAAWNGRQGERLEALVRETGCNKDLRSLVSKPGEYCDCRDTELKGFLECRHEHPQGCKYMLPFGYGFFCKCPLALYLYREMKK